MENCQRIIFKDGNLACKKKEMIRYEHHTFISRAMILTLEITKSIWITGTPCWMLLETKRVLLPWQSWNSNKNIFYLTEVKKQDCN